MNVSKEIIALREKAGLTVGELATLLDVVPRTVMRYEDGTGTPKPKTLKRLADVAEAHGLAHLRDVFEGKRRAGIISRIGRLPSARTERRLPLLDLKYGSAYLQHVSRSIQDVLKNEPALSCPEAREQLKWNLVIASQSMEHVRSEILEPYIAEPYSSARLLEDEKLVRGQRDRMQQPRRKTQSSTMATTKRRKSARRKLTPTVPRARA